MHTQRTEVRFPKILRGMFCPIAHQFNELTTLVSLSLGARRIEIKSPATLGADELKLLLGLLAMAMSDQHAQLIDSDLTESRLKWFSGQGVMPKSIRWSGTRYQLLSQAAFGMGGTDYKRIDESVDRLMAVVINLHSDTQVEKFSLIEYARIGKTKSDPSVELQLNPLLSTILTVDLKQSDPRLFGYFRLLFSDLQKIPKSGFCLYIYLAIQCRMLELQGRRPVEYSIGELRGLLQYELIKDAVVRKRKVSVGSFNRQIRVGLNAVCVAMGWTICLESDRFVIELAPRGWYIQAGFLSEDDASTFGCSSINFRNFGHGFDKTSPTVGQNSAFWKYLKWMIQSGDPIRMNHARQEFLRAKSGFQELIYRAAGTGNSVARQLTAIIE